MQDIKDQNHIRNTENRENPFFVPYHTPHDTVPFNRILLEDYEPAFMEGIRRDKEATDKVINDPAKLHSRILSPVWIQKKANITTTF